MHKDIIFLKASKVEVGEEDEYHSSVVRLCGLTPFSIPVIDFNFTNNESLINALKSISSFSALIFTSPRAVKAFEQAISNFKEKEEFKIPSFFQDVQIFVVGKATAKAISELGLRSKGQDTGSAENLAKYILEQGQSDVFNKQMLFIHGNLARNTLPSIIHSAGAKIKSICVYETVPHPNFLETFSLHLQRHKNPGFIVFFSPSGAEFYLKPIKEMTKELEGIKILAIGKTTAESLGKMNCEIYGIADSPKAESLCQCIMSKFDEK
eukprot:gene7322-8140_t